MNAYIFAGLNRTAQHEDLHTIVHLFILENGGRIKLAEKIESEWVKSTYRRPLKRDNDVNRFWHNGEVTYLKRFFKKKPIIELAVKLDRTVAAISQKAHLLGISDSTYRNRHIAKKSR